MHVSHPATILTIVLMVTIPNLCLGSDTCGGACVTQAAEQCAPAGDDKPDNKRVGSLKVGEDFSELAFAQNGRLLVGLDSSAWSKKEVKDRTVHVWNVCTAAEVARLEYSRNVWGLAVCPSSNFLVTTTGRYKGSNFTTIQASGGILKWDITNGHLLKKWTQFGAGVGAVSISNDGKIFAVTTKGKDDLFSAREKIQRFNIKIKDAMSGRTIGVLWHGPAKFVQLLALSPNKAILASVSGSLRLWNVKQMSEIVVRTDKATWSPDVTAIAFSPDSKYLAVSHANKQRIEILSLTNVVKPGKVQSTNLNTDAGRISKLQFSFDGKFLAASSRPEVKV